MSGPGLAYADRVQETSASSGTGALTLAGAVTGSQAFSTAFTTGQTVYYTIYNGSGQWEVGRGTYTTSTTQLSRDQVFSSSNSGSLVSFSAGTQYVFCDFPAVAIADMGRVVAFSGFTVGY